jgi:hypothetical protein
MDVHGVAGGLILIAGSQREKVARAGVLNPHREFFGRTGVSEFEIFSMDQASLPITGIFRGFRCQRGLLRHGSGLQADPRRLTGDFSPIRRNDASVNLPRFARRCFPVRGG